MCSRVQTSSEDTLQQQHSHLLQNQTSALAMTKTSPCELSHMVLVCSASAAAWKKTNKSLVARKQQRQQQQQQLRTVSKWVPLFLTGTVVMPLFSSRHLSGESGGAGRWTTLTQSGVHLAARNAGVCLQISYTMLISGLFFFQFYVHCSYSAKELGKQQISDMHRYKKKKGKKHNVPTLQTTDFVQKSKKQKISQN